MFYDLEIIKQIWNGSFFNHSLFSTKEKVKQTQNLPAAKPKKDDSNAVSIFDAAAKGDLSDLAKVLKKNNINAVNASDKTLLHIAAANGHVAIIEYLINKGAKLDVKDKKGRTPMHRAAEKGQDDAVKVLLQAGAYIYSLDKEAKTPLHLAAQTHHTHILKRILKEEARCYKDQQNFLHMAALKDESNLAQMLLKNGAPVDAKDEKGQTALGYAISQGFDKTVKVLLEAGASIDSNIIDVAFNNNKQSIFTILGTDINARNEMQYTPLLMACEMGKTEIAEVLIAKGASLEERMPNSNTVLHLAVQAEAVSITNLLLHKGMNANITSQGEQTPLHVAAFHNKGSIVDILINAGAKINAVTKELVTPLHVASQRGNVDVDTTSFSSDVKIIYTWAWLINMRIMKNEAGANKNKLIFRGGKYRYTHKNIKPIVDLVCVANSLDFIMNLMIFGVFLKRPNLESQMGMN
uniref:Uncharacterized protein n=1 Tax=Gopherus evgoodei TaxID=1825980 RepID=A0A8C4YT27_9SAUR